MFRVAHLPNRCHANHGNLADLAGRHAKLCVIALFGNDLCKPARRANHLPAFSGSQLDIMNLGAERNILDRQSISRQNIGFLAAQYHRADLETDRSENVSLFAVEVVDQSDMSRAIRIVFKLCDFAGNAGLVTLEIDDPVKTLVASAAAPDRNAAIVVVAGNFLLWLEQLFLGYCPFRQFVACQIRLIAACRRCRF